MYRARCTCGCTPYHSCYTYLTTLGSPTTIGSCSGGKPPAWTGARLRWEAFQVLNPLKPVAAHLSDRGGDASLGARYPGEGAVSGVPVGGL